MHVYDGEIKKGKLPEYVSNGIKRLFEMYEGRRIKIIISEYKNPRSSKQNRFYWGYVIPVITEMFRQCGNSAGADEVHEYLKRHVGKLVDVIETPDGQKKFITKSSAKLTTEEWENYINEIRAWAAQFGVAVPFPGEDYDLRS
jgi:hypothetical protein